MRLDLKLAYLALFGNLARLGFSFTLDARVLGGDHRLLAGFRAFCVADGFHLLDFQALTDTGLFFLLFQGQALFGRFQLCLANRDIGFRFNFNTLLFIGGDDFGKLTHPYRVERVVLVECGKRRLVEARQRYGIKQHAVLRQVVAHEVGHAAHELAALFVQAIHGFRRHHGLQGVDEAAFQ